ncbi:WS/DGAT/MGAT family O-acyltransferase [Rhodococcus artemisiae]|uniref:Diacylglycerol O-acyltransferase n=1 Tax=Rhodococcus artemisiae TaxID=714159 RepID=A0ABU7LFA4_9NOCA|nr:wax ester/triacylglycerol synthase family O-acyltransferase [Rhodococcus artemisiae]MEE2059932.1 wax ester/triacylglycerol synthase family O-acyltransferase [Rhodococcus artemisiae]
MRLPMSPTDSMFLLGETREHPMHVGGLVMFEPPEGRTASDLREMFVDAIARSDGEDAAPLWRKRAVRSPATFGQWAWEDDPSFDLEYHVRFTALPRPGSTTELRELVSRLHAPLLDRARALWEMYLIEGLDDGRYGLYMKMHHALADGVGAMRLLRRALSSDPDETGMPAPWAVPDTSDPQRSVVGAAIEMPSTAMRAARGVISEALGLVPTIIGTVDRAMHDRGGSLSLAAPQTILNVPIAGSRRFAARAWRLERLRMVAKASDSTLNDVVLAMCSGALRAFLAERDSLPDESLVAMVPVALRNGKDSGNDLGVLMCSLGTDRPETAQRLAGVRTSMSEGKKSMSGMSTVSRLAASAVGVAPLALGVLTGNRVLSRPGFNVIISNVPGPDTPLYWNGARVDAVYPLSVPLDGQALNITCTSTDGRIAFGLTACRRTVPDLGTLLDHLDAELVALEHAVGISPGVDVAEAGF